MLGHARGSRRRPRRPRARPGRRRVVRVDLEQEGVQVGDCLGELRPQHLGARPLGGLDCLVDHGCHTPDAFIHDGSDPLVEEEGELTARLVERRPARLQGPSLLGWQRLVLGGDRSHHRLVDALVEGGARLRHARLHRLPSARRRAVSHRGDCRLHLAHQSLRHLLGLLTDRLLEDRRQVGHRLAEHWTHALLEGLFEHRACLLEGLFDHRSCVPE